MSKDNQTTVKTYEQAITLLKDHNLVWSTDLETIRQPLVGLMEWELLNYKATGHTTHHDYIELAERLTADA